MQNTAQGTPSGQAPAAQPSKRERPPKPVAPPEFQAERIDKLNEADLIELLKKAGATDFEKAKACQRLATIGSKQAVPALAALLTDAKLAHYGRYGLEPIPDPSVDDALRGALPKVKGLLLIGVINSVGMRKDAKAVPALTKLMYDSDPEVAKAAASSLGEVSGLSASKALQEGLTKTKGAVRNAVADAGLVCAEGLLAQGQREEALDLYTILSGPEIPKPMRLGAMHAIIAAETSLSRPR